MKAPNGNTITGTLETIPGECGIFFAEDGSYDFDGNGTEVFWDGQETVTIAGQTVFVDECGEQWLECELIPDDAEAVPLLKRKPWHEQPNLRAIEVQDTIEKLFQRLGKKDATMTVHIVRSTLDILEVSRDAP